jgi:hypothetical protein
LRQFEGQQYSSVNGHNRTSAAATPPAIVQFGLSTTSAALQSVASMQQATKIGIGMHRFTDYTLLSW